MLSETQSRTLTDWYGWMSKAYGYGMQSAKQGLTPRWWLPVCETPNDKVCIDSFDSVSTEEDIAALNMAADAAYSTHAQIENQTKREEFDGEYENAISSGLTDGSENNDRSYKPEGVWWFEYKQMLEQAYENAYNKAQSVVYPSSSKAWWIAGAVGLAVVTVVSIAALAAGGPAPLATRNPAKNRGLKYEYQLRDETGFNGYGWVHYTDEISEAIESAKRNEPDFDTLEVRTQRNGKIVGTYKKVSPGNWKKVG